MPNDGKYKCEICGKRSDSEKSESDQKRSITQHINFTDDEAHDIEPNVDASEFRVRVVEDKEDELNEKKAQELVGNQTLKSPNRQRPNRQPQRNVNQSNIVFIVQAEYGSDFEAKSEIQTLLRNKPDFEDFTFQEGRFLLVRASTKEKAEFVKRGVENFTDPINVDIKEEYVETDEGGFLSKINPFSSSSSDQSQQRRVQEERPPQRRNTSQRGKNPAPQRGGNPAPQSTNEPGAPQREPQKIGRTVTADNYKHFQETEADSTTMEGLMLARQQIAKGEQMGGHDPMKWVVAIIVLLIGLAVAYGVFTGVIGGEGGLPIPGLPGHIP